MKNFILVSLIWAFSFSLIGEFISGKMNIFLAINIRIVLATLVLLPFLKIKSLSPKIIGHLLITGALQIGLMYVFYFQSFTYLKVPEVALLTAFTPIFVQLMDSLKMTIKTLLALSFCILGALWIKWTQWNSPSFWLGFFTIQMANLCFAFGQVYYKKKVKLSEEMKAKKISDLHVFAFFHIGALILTLPLMFWKTPVTDLHFDLTPSQWLSLVWLGVVASGLGYWLWNASTTKVPTTWLANANNLVIPLAILVNFLFWNTPVNWAQFLPGAALIALGLYLSQDKATIKT